MSKHLTVLTLRGKGRTTLTSCPEHRFNGSSCSRGALVGCCAGCGPGRARSVTCTWAMCTYLGVWEALAAGTPARAAVLICVGAEVPAAAPAPPPLPSLRPPGWGGLPGSSRRPGSYPAGRAPAPQAGLPAHRLCVPPACPWARLLPVLQRLPHALAVLGTHFGKAHACAHLHSHVTGTHAARMCASPVHSLPCAFPCTGLTCCHAVNHLPPHNPGPPPQNPGQLKCCNIVAA